MAQKNQPLFDVVHSNRAMAMQKLTAAKGVLYPQISAFGKYELFSDYLSAMEPDWVVGIQANLTLFSGGKNISNIRSATHLIKEIDQVDSTLQRDISLWINKAYREMRSAENSYVHLDADLELANENLHQCQSRFENGYGTSLEVIDAQLVLERNKVERLVALGDYYKALTELYTAAGKPSEAIKYITGDNR
jgi:outer membrane protein TolC